MKFWGWFESSSLKNARTFLCRIDTRITSQLPTCGVDVSAISQRYAEAKSDGETDQRCLDAIRQPLTVWIRRKNVLWRRPVKIDS